MQRRVPNARVNEHRVSADLPRGGSLLRALPIGRAVRRRCEGLVLGAAIALAAVVALSALPALAVPPSGIFTGFLSDGAAYEIEIPVDWNGTLVLFSHGYVAPGFPNPALTAADPVTRQWLVGHGYSVAGSSYSSTGWAVEDAIGDQIETLDVFLSIAGPPARTISTGHSMGSLIAESLVELHPDRFSGALPMCGILGGGVAEANMLLDQAFVLKTLVFPEAPVQLVDIDDAYGNYFAAISALMGAEADPTGRSQARIALAAAVGGLPGWYDPLDPQPDRNDHAARLQGQIEWINYVSFFAFALRAEIEARAGGNPSWNTAVDYGQQLARSHDSDSVHALYAAAGLDLVEDLATLDATPRISANEQAVGYLKEFRNPGGDIEVPVLTMHTTGDGLVPVSHENSYSRAVAGEGGAGRLRQLYVERGGHCTFTSAEVVSGILALERRLDLGHWSGTDPDDLNARALALGPELGFVFASPSMPAEPAFSPFVPATLLRAQKPIE